MDSNLKYKISIVIVNYNVEYFLDQCLDSVRKGIKDISAEVFIVDNCSVDGSIEMVKSKYPEFTLIENKDNVGFSRANNQAIRQASGEYILLLNPDTVVEEDTFSKTVRFMDERPDSGGLGVRMIDGKGIFLPESKRGLPTPLVAFYKIFGLSSLFPKSKRFGQYHLGHLSEFENHQIDVLSGAYMLMRKSTLDKVGLLDESFFMYGEDIDLSYRITLGGYKNYYCSDTKIIHYKGESTKKSSVNYVFVFYRAMIIFAQKHLSGNNAKLFSILINLAIYFRAFMAISLRVLKRSFLPTIDFIYVTVGLYALTNYWKMSNIEFPMELIKYSIPTYSLIWIYTCFFNGGYDTPLKLSKTLKGIFIGTLIILLAYAVLPKSWQFSRLFIFVGAGWAMTYFYISRNFLHFTIGKHYKLRTKGSSSFGIINNDDSETRRIEELIRQTNNNISTINQINPDAINTIENGTYNEIIFSAKNYSYKEIINWMSELNLDQTDYKIAPDSENYLIGSNSIDTPGELYILNLNALVSNENKRKKRLFDVLFSFSAILLTPFSVWNFENKLSFVKNMISILLGNRSFIGFSEDVSKKDVRLPKIKPGILVPADLMGLDDSKINEKLNLLYARDYSMRKDFSIVLKAWKKLDT
ncbi:MAG: glycosyltransferase [Crocinitomicaceae bacterium]|nr:glycosyltransferase [Crocinitomicaceae bacterium]MDG1777125.1 glycosyltransferase [Crocinitomicaceae bacterium]